MMKTITTILLALLYCCIMFSADANAKKLKQHFHNKNLPKTSYIAIPVQTPAHSWHVSAQLRLPQSSVHSTVPAVVILHSSAGIDSTGRFYARALNNVGIATLELDLWGARDLQGGSANRPNSPQETLPDVFAALGYLSNHAQIDKDRIGVIGFSWGGILSLLTATNQYMAMTGNDYRFAGHVAHYPICWLFNYAPGFELENLTGAPVLIQTGQLDDYDLPETCPTLVNDLAEQDKELITLKVYKKAYHAWDRLEPTWLVEDPFSNLGAGGQVTLAANKRIAKKSKRRVVNFFSKLFGLNSVSHLTDDNHNNRNSENDDD